MRIEVLDKKKANHNCWFLGKISLWDYLSSVTTDHFAFDIQRGIIKNKYLDTILTSIKKQEPIPPITITSEALVIRDDNFIEVNSFEILDGLQRTYRLWIYKQISELSEPINDLFGNKSYNISDVVRSIKESGNFIPGIISITQIKSLLNLQSEINVSSIQELYSNFSIYLYIWSGLDEQDIVKKMLILNAGQRKVSIGHQYELIFLQIFKDKNLFENVRLVREKDNDYGIIKTGERKIGEFIFSTMVIGLQSLIAEKPMRLSYENLEFENDDDFISEETTERFFNQPFINIYLEKLYDLDYLLCTYEASYKKWFVKDTTISGIMGAIGKYREINGSNDNKNFNITINKLQDGLIKNSYFQLSNFYSEYNNLSSTKINIGEKVRLAIYKYTLALMKDNPITWKDAFNIKEEII